MKKVFFLLALTMFVSPAVWADDNQDCYDLVKSKLKNSTLFSSVLPDAWNKDSHVVIECTKESKAFGKVPKDVQEGDRIGKGELVADVVITVKPLNGLGGEGTSIHVEGSWGELYKVADSEFFDVSVFNYSLSHYKDK